jgi:streptogramin lyase
MILGGGSVVSRASPAAPAVAGEGAPPVTEYPIQLPNAGPLSIAQARDGTFWVAEFSAGQITQFLPANNTFRQFVVPEAHAQPAFVALDNLGRVWFSDQEGEGSIWMFDQADNTFTKHSTATVFSVPVGVLVDGKNNVWFAEDTGNALGELVYPSYTIREFPLPHANSGPAELALQAGGSALWLTESIGNRIAMFDISSQTFKEYVPSVPFASPVGIVLDESGNVWVSEHGGSSIVRFEPSPGTFTKFPTSPPPPSSQYPNSAPATLAIDSQGRLWFVEHFSNTVGRLDPATQSIDEFRIPSSGVYSILSAVDSSGNFWFTEFTANKIGTIPKGALIPIMVGAASTNSPSVAAGESLEEQFTVRNAGSSSIKVQLASTSTFSGSHAAVILNATELSLAPGQKGSVLVRISPDRSVAAGRYSFGVTAQEANISTVGIGIVEVTTNPIDTFLYQSLPDILLAPLLILALANVYIRLVRRQGGSPPRPAPATKPSLLSAVMISAAYFVASWLIPVAKAKCPGLPGLGSQGGGPSYAGVFFDVVEVAGIIILGYFLVRGLTNERRKRKRIQGGP